jgi:hypothetical protein
VVRVGLLPAGPAASAPMPGEEPGEKPGEEPGEEEHQAGLKTDRDDLLP